MDGAGVWVDFSLLRLPELARELRFTGVVVGDPPLVKARCSLGSDETMSFVRRMRTTSRVAAPDILCAVCVWMGPEVRVPRRLPSCRTGLRRGTEPGVVVGDPTLPPLVKARCSLRLRSISRVAAPDILSTLHNSKKQAASMATSKTMSSAGVSSHIVRVEHNSRQRLSPRSALLACRLSVPRDSLGRLWVQTVTPFA